MSSLEMNVSKTSDKKLDRTELEKAKRQLAKGFLVPAADIYTRFLKQNPKDMPALLGMATVSYRSGHIESALGFIEKVLEQDPDHAEAYAIKGKIFFLTDQIDEAMKAYRMALDRDLRNETAWRDLGDIFARLESYDQLYAMGEEALKKDPDNEFALHAVGSVLIIKNQHIEALEIYQKLIALNPNLANAYYNLGNAYHWLGHYKEAAIVYRKALKLAPKFVEAKENLILTLVKLWEDEEAAALMPSLLRETPNPRRALDLLGHTYRNTGNVKKALEISQELYRRYPETSYLENCLIDSQLAEDEQQTGRYYPLLLQKEDVSSTGIAMLYTVARVRNDWETAQKLWPKLTKIVEETDQNGGTLRNFGNLNVISEPKATPELIKKAHVLTADNFRTNRPVDWKPDHRKAFSPSAKIRIGIVSGDFYAHVVSYFINGWVKYHDRSRFEIYCYANMPEDKRDQITAAYQMTVHRFTFVDKMPHREMAEMIQNDGIHILVDLTGYTEGTLLEMIVYKPAPIIATWLGYPCTTGCTEVDYVIGDKWFEHPDHERMYVEKMLVLEDSTYFAGQFAHIDPVIEPPVKKKGYITFGSLMNPYKMNPVVFETWAKIVQKVPNSRLMLNHPKLNAATDAYKNIIRAFEKAGFPMDRLDISHERHPIDGKHFRFYHEFDIALDTFPQTGGTTTFESLLMAVPVITLVGTSFLSRISYSIINNAGLEDAAQLCSFSIEEYIDKAVSLAQDIDRLTALRREIGARIHSSNLFSPRKMTRQLEEAFVRAWNEKYPDFPTSQLLKVEMPEEEAKNQLKTVKVPIDGQPITFLTADADGDIFNFILQEQEGWFDPEYHFVLNVLEGPYDLMDCCDDIGVYSLPMARKVNAEGKVTACVRSPERKFMFQMAAPDELNIQLFDPAINPFEGIDRLDFLRVSSEFNDDDFGGLIARHIKQLATLEPIIFFSAKQNNEFDLTMLDALTEHGFTIYRYVPGLDLLAPFDRSQDVDTFLVNLWACKGKGESSLYEQGKLVSLSESQQLYVPDLSAEPCLEWLKTKNYTEVFRAEWERVWHEDKSNLFEVYRTVLDAWAIAQQTTQKPAIRYQALSFAATYIQPLLAVASDMAIELSAGRILADIGAREASVKVLGQLKDRFKEGDIILHWPFLPVDNAWDAIDPEGRLAEWLLGSTMEAFEFRRAFSSYFIGEPHMEPLQNVLAMGFNRPSVSRRVELLRAQFL